MEEINLKAKMDKLLKEYGDEIGKVVEEAVRETAKSSVKKLRAKKSFASNSHATGEYARGWKADIKRSRLNTTATIYNAKLPSRVHLLENGHVTRNGDGREYPRTPAYPHVAPVAKEAETELVERIEEKVKG